MTDKYELSATRALFRRGTDTQSCISSSEESIIDQKLV